MDQQSIIPVKKQKEIVTSVISQSRTIKPGIQLGIKNIIREIAAAFKLRTSESVGLQQHVHYDSTPVTRNKTKLFHEGRGPGGEFKQSFGEPTMGKDKHFIFFGLRFLSGFVPLNNPDVVEKGIANYQPGFAVQPLLQHGKLSLGCGDRTYFKDMTLTQFEAQFANFNSMEESYFVGDQAMVWFADKQLECEVYFPDSVINVIKNNTPVDLQLWLRLELIGIQLN